MRDRFLAIMIVALVSGAAVACASTGETRPRKCHTQECRVKQYEERVAAYQKRVAAYEKRVSAYEERSAAYQDRVADTGRRELNLQLEVDDLRGRLQECQEKLVLPDGDN